jgi:hypothetical protein
MPHESRDVAEGVVQPVPDLHGCFVPDDGFTVSLAGGICRSFQLYRQITVIDNTDYGENRKRSKA